MGFYGNLTNTAHTQFQFDKIYPNRYSMERNIANDGVYLGRYVLVEYDADIHEDTIKIAYVGSPTTNEDGGTYYEAYYTTVDHNQEYVFNTFLPVAQGVVNDINFKDYFVEENGLHFPATGYNADTIYYSLESGNIIYGVEKGEFIQTRSFDGTLNGEFFICVGGLANNVAVFENVTEEVENNFLLNYRIDINYFGPRSPEGAYSRAWDSTVWQKVYEAGEVKYIMIAELNTASPSFSLTFDPPTQTPLAPHVDASSANNVYRVHLQPSWGFRIKEAEDPEFSDLKVQHITSLYDSDANQVNQSRITVDGAIYWNNKGFDSTKSVHDYTTKNYIAFEPTGQSGMTYASHKGYLPTDDVKYKDGKIYYTYDSNFFIYEPIDTTSLVDQDIEEPNSVYEYKLLPTYDINEFSISMPAFGNAIADFYDLVYGANENNNDIRYRDVAWKNYHGLLRDAPNDEIGGMTRDRSTVAGTLNYIHDLTGMIISELETMPTEQEIQNNLSSELIYCLPAASPTAQNQFFFRAQTNRFNTSIVPYIYTLVDTTTDPYIENCYFKVASGTTVDENTEFIKDLGELDFSNDYDYYKRLINGSTYKLIGLLTNYESGKYYYRIGSDYYRETSLNFESDRTYYDLDSSFRWRETLGSETLEPYHHYYFDLRELPANDSLRIQYPDVDFVEMGWTPTEDAFFADGKNYYTVENGVLVPYENWIPDTAIPNDLVLVERTVNPIEYGTTTVANLASPSELWNHADVSTITENSLNFKASYVENAFYYREFRQTVTLDAQHTIDAYDYILDTEYREDEDYPYMRNREYYNVAPVPLEGTATLYQPGQFFYFENDDGEHQPFDENAQYGEEGYPQPIRDINEYPTLGRYYWDVLLSEPTWVINSNGRWEQIVTIIGWVRVTNLVSVSGQFITDDPENPGMLILTPEDPNFIYYYTTEEDPNRYILLHTSNRNILTMANYQLYSLNINLEETSPLVNDDFYVKNRYYYFDENNNLLVDTNKTKDDARHYYALTTNDNTGVLTNASEVKFYVQDIYYYLIGNVYRLDTNSYNTDPDTRQYYEKDVYRVAEDILGIYAPGCRWNGNAMMVPCTITLGVAEPYYELREIGNVGTKAYSINNLILKYNKVLAEGDKYIRSNNSVQGTLNLYQDAISKIDSDMVPNRIVITDHYGRITNSNYSIDELLNRISVLEAKVAALES